MARANWELKAPMCAPPQARDLQENQKALTEMYLTDPSTVKIFWFFSFWCLHSSVSYNHALNSKFNLWDRARLCTKWVLNGYLEEGPHINIQDILTGSRKGSVRNFYLARLERILVWLTDIFCLYPKYRAKVFWAYQCWRSQAPQEDHQKTYFRKGLVLHCAKISLKHLRKKHASSRARNSILMGLLRQIL